VLVLPLLVACTTTAGEPLPWANTADTGAAAGFTTTATAIAWEIERTPGCNPLGIGDDCFLPYPSTYWTVEDETAPSGLRLAYHADALWSPDGPLPVDPVMFNFADGASPTSPVMVNLGRDVASAQLWGWGSQGDSLADGVPVALIHAETGARVPLLTEMDQTNRDLGYAGRHALILRPMAPLEHGARYLAVLTADLRDEDGAPFDSPDAFVALRDDIPTSDREVEAMRPRYGDLFDVAASAGFAQDDLLLAWEFQVSSDDGVTGPIRSMRAQALADIADSGVPYEITEIEFAPNDDVAVLVRGTFQPPNFLDDTNSLELDPGFGVTEQSRERPSYDFTMIIPPVALERGGLPLVQFGHGIFGTGEGYLTGGTGEAIVQPLAAEHEVVVIATDWIGLSSGDLNLILDEVTTDLSRITLVTDRLAQSLVNNLALTELALGALQSDPALGLDAGEALLDSDAVYYYGISLGGIQGSSLVSISPRISRAVVAVPGGGWTHMIQRSVHFAEIEVLIDLLYPDPLSQTAFISMLQGYFDRSDPAGLVSLMEDDRVVLIQEAIGDCQVPNMATDILARGMGAAHLDVASDPIYGLDTVKGPSTGRAISQFRLPDRLDEFFPLDENTIPETNNDVHSAIITEAPTLDQVAALLVGGVLIHPCDGACDPD